MRGMSIGFGGRGFKMEEGGVRVDDDRDRGFNVKDG